MLPFLKRKDQSASSGMIIQQRKPDEGKEDEAGDDKADHAMEAAAQDILRAIEAKDSAHLALALRSAYDICESGEDDEPSSDDKPSPHTYDAQNIKAAE